MRAELQHVSVFFAGHNQGRATRQHVTCISVLDSFAILIRPTLSLHVLFICNIDFRPTLLTSASTGVGKGVIRVTIEDEKVLEVSGQLRLKIEAGVKDWRAGNWWEHGCVRRIELPENADWKKTEAFLSTGDHTLLEVKIPKIPPNISDVP